MYAKHRKHMEEYSAQDLRAIRALVFERAAGYPNLKKFEGGANWPDPDEHNLRPTEYDFWA
jgi:hypothetical protein